jgi:hypothetical protein
VGSGTGLNAICFLTEILIQLTYSSFHQQIYGTSNDNVQKDKQCTYKVIFRRVRVTIVAVEKQLSITYSECVSVILIIQHAMRMCRIILSSVSCLALPLFSPHYLINGTIFRKKLFNMNMCFDFL